MVRAPGAGVTRDLQGVGFRHTRDSQGVGYRHIQSKMQRQTEMSVFFYVRKYFP